MHIDRATQNAFQQSSTLMSNNSPKNEERELNPLVKGGGDIEKNATNTSRTSSSSKYGRIIAPIAAAVVLLVAGAAAIGYYSSVNNSGEQPLDARNISANGTTPGYINATTSVPNITDIAYNFVNTTFKIFNSK